MTWRYAMTLVDADQLEQSALLHCCHAGGLDGGYKPLGLVGFHVISCAVYVPQTACKTLA